MELKELLQNTDIVKTLQGCAERLNIELITADSRKCAKGCLFVAVKGAAADGALYIDKAIAAGASVVVSEVEPKELKENVTYIVVKNSRIAEAQIAVNFYRNPSKRLRLVGVTGTNGKTSIATLLYRMFTALGNKCGLLSTIANYICDTKYPTINTTPGPIELNRLLDEMASKGCAYCFMEVSSHSIDQERVAGLEFSGGIFTNLTHDHLDYHKTFENYRDCKKRFFDSLPPTAFALTNIDDRNGLYMVQNTKAQVKTYSCYGVADFKSKILEQSVDGMELNINGKNVWCNFIGLYNAENLTAVYAAAVLLGANREEALQILSGLHSVEGRMECCKGGDNITAAIDYAHTPDALENVLKTLQALRPKGDLICVFGCGGDRDKTKRSEMGAIAGHYATKIYVTSDNPRTEDPLAIIEDIKKGMNEAAVKKSQFIPDRVEAINASIREAKPNSIILIAGKGHEDYQIIGTVKHHLDDRETAEAAFDKVKKQ